MNTKILMYALLVCMVALANRNEIKAKDKHVPLRLIAAESFYNMNDYKVKSSGEEFLDTTFVQVEYPHSKIEYDILASITSMGDN